MEKNAKMVASSKKLCRQVRKTNLTRIIINQLLLPKKATLSYLDNIVLLVKLLVFDVAVVL